MQMIGLVRRLCLRWGLLPLQRLILCRGLSGRIDGTVRIQILAIFIAPIAARRYAFF